MCKNWCYNHCSNDTPSDNDWLVRKKPGIKDNRIKQVPKVIVRIKKAGKMS